jgi:hypothetical protein
LNNDIELIKAALESVKPMTNKEIDMAIKMIDLKGFVSCSLQIKVIIDNLTHIQDQILRACDKRKDLNDSV